MRSEAEQERWVMYLHEAAHAIILARKGGEPSYIAAHVCHAARPAPTLTSELCYTLAGLAAEAIEQDGDEANTAGLWLLGELDECGRGDLQSDFSRAIETAAGARKTKNARGRLLDTAAAEALALCRENWPQIQELAEQLEAALKSDPGGCVGVYHLTHPGELLHVANQSGISLAQPRDRLGSAGAALTTRAAAKAPR